jgi:hypothetical protein
MIIPITKPNTYIISGDKRIYIYLYRMQLVFEESTVAVINMAEGNIILF